MPISDVIRNGTSRGLDFIRLDSLRKRTGVTESEILPWAMLELLSNALDKEASKISIEITQANGFSTIKVADNGAKKITKTDVDLILNFENEASSKRGLLIITRGSLGNALKCIFGYSYALPRAMDLECLPILIESGSSKFEIRLKPDSVKGRIESQLRTEERLDDGFTSISVAYPGPVKSWENIVELVQATALINPGRIIEYEVLGRKSSVGSKSEFKPLRRETSVLWYSFKEFESLFQDFQASAPQTQIKDFISIFRGFTSKKITRSVLEGIGEKLQELKSESNHDCGLQFFPSLELERFPTRAIEHLYACMRERSNPILNRSNSRVLGCVGEEGFEKVARANGWLLRYYSIPGVHEEIPYVVELAVFDRPEDSKGLKVLQCFNFMATEENLFSNLFDVNYRLGRVGIHDNSPVTVVSHLVSPKLTWLTYGKTSLGE